MASKDGGKKSTAVCRAPLATTRKWPRRTSLADPERISLRPRHALESSDANTRRRHPLEPGASEPFHRETEILQPLRSEGEIRLSRVCDDTDGVSTAGRGKERKVGNAHMSSMNGLISLSKLAIAFPPLPAPAAIANAAALSALDILAGLLARLLGRAVSCDGSKPGGVAPLPPPPPLLVPGATERSGMTKEPSCIRSGPERAAGLGVVVSHSQLSKEETEGRGAFPGRSSGSVGVDWKAV